MRSLLILAILLLASCSSPQTHFFSLQPVTGAAAAVPADAVVSRAPPIVIRHIMLPATLDRLSIVSTGRQGQLIISDRDRWAAPLDGMVQAVLATDLAALLPGQVVIPGDPVPSGDKRALAFTVRSFAGNTAGRVTLQADWFLLHNGEAIPGLGGSETIVVDTGSAATEAIVPAMSRALFLLSKRIAPAIQMNAHKPANYR